jgi:hypothetical protein
LESFLPTSTGEAPAGQSVKALGWDVPCAEHPVLRIPATAHATTMHAILFIVVLSVATSACGTA